MGWAYQLKGTLIGDGGKCSRQQSHHAGDDVGCERHGHSTTDVVPTGMSSPLQTTAKNAKDCGLGLKKSHFREMGK
jgi:hypothetical protein